MINHSLRKTRSETQDVLVMANHPIASLLTHCRLVGDLVAYCIGRASTPLQTRPQRLLGYAPAPPSRSYNRRAWRGRCQGVAILPRGLRP